MGYPRLDVAMLANEPLLGIVSIRSALALAMFAVAAVVMGMTRLGRDVVAVGSDNRAAAVAGGAGGAPHGRRLRRVRRAHGAERARC